MDQKDLLNGAVADLRSVLPGLSRSEPRLGERLEEAIRHLTAAHIDALAARDALQEVENSLLQAESMPKHAEREHVLHIVRAADQKLTAALSAGHYSQG